MSEVRLLDIGEIEQEVFSRWDITGHQVNRHLLSKALTGTEGVVLDHLTFPPGFVHHMHRHPNADMVVIALSGVVQFLGAPGSSVEVSRAHVLVIPCGNWHQISNEGTVDSQVLHFFAGVGSVDDIGYENRPWVCPLMPTPQKPSSVIALFGFHDHSIRVLGGQRRQCVEPGRLARNDFGAAVVDRPTEVGGLLDVTCWVPGARDRHDLHVDARVVHDP